MQRSLLIIFFALLFTLYSLSVFAGNIDTDFKFAWGENVGWINFAPSQGEGVTVTDTALTGYAWGENIGWIKMNPSSGGVANDGSGNLSGYAWGENAGWINFSPTGGGVTIDQATGVFSGFAWGENVGWINFKPTGGGVKTLWRSNQPPVANDQTLDTVEDASLVFSLSATDPNGDPLTFTIVSDPSNGTLSGIAPNVTYNPSANYNGTDSFTFQVSDGKVDSNIATVSITINAVNDAPSFVKGPEQTVLEDAGPQTIAGWATSISAGPPDEAAQAVNFLVTNNNNSLFSSQPVVTDVGTLTYTPAANANGSATVTVVLQDNGGTANGGVDTSNSQTFNITVTPVNDAPVANSQSVTTEESTTITITLNGSDVDGDALSYEVVAGPSSGTISGTIPNLTYTPNANYSGSDSFTFKANDGVADSNIANVSITISPLTISYRFQGFFSPVDNPENVNDAKAGQTIPVKWRITDKNGVPISNAASFAGLRSYQINCESILDAPTSAVEENSVGSSGLQYLGDGYWQFNWKTAKTYAGQCRTMMLTLRDGSTHLAYFKFK